MCPGLSGCAGVAACPQCSRGVSLPPAAARAGGQVCRVHGDAPRGAGGAQEPPEQDRAQHHIPALPLARPVPHGASPAAPQPPSHPEAGLGLRLCGRPLISQPGSGFELRAPASSHWPLSYVRKIDCYPSLCTCLQLEPQLLGRCYLYIIFSDLKQAGATSAARVHSRIPRLPAWCCWLFAGLLIILLVPFSTCDLKKGFSLCELWHFYIFHIISPQSFVEPQSDLFPVWVSRTRLGRGFPGG